MVLVNNYINNSLFLRIIKIILKKNHREKFFRELKIILNQNKNFKVNFKSNLNKLVLFIVPSADFYGNEPKAGGVISIDSIFHETVKLKNIFGFDCIMVTESEANLYENFAFFESDTKIYRFEQLNRFSKIDHIILHIPEYLTAKLLNDIRVKRNKLFKHVEYLHINILNQNIKLMPSKQIIDELKKNCHLVTQTTAHFKYASPSYRQYYDIPLHHFSTFLNPDHYQRTDYNKKRNLIVMSKDDKSKNEIVKNYLVKRGYNFDFIVIENITYTKYKSLMADSKFAFTFGEGLDFYFTDSFLYGGICFAIYNEEFFMSEFKDLESIYGSFDHLQKNILSTLKHFEDPVNYKNYNSFVVNLIKKYYNYENYKHNIYDFYNGNYLLP